MIENDIIKRPKEFGKFLLTQQKSAFRKIIFEGQQLK